MITGIETDIIQNHEGTFYTYKAGLYRSFNEVDLKEVKRLKSVKSLNEQKRLYVDTQALFASFASFSLLAILADQSEIGEAFVRAIEHKNLQDKPDGDEEVEHADLRRISSNLTQSKFYRFYSESKDQVKYQYRSIVQHHLGNV